MSSILRQPGIKIPLKISKTGRSGSLNSVDLREIFTFCNDSCDWVPKVYCSFIRQRVFCGALNLPSDVIPFRIVNTGDQGRTEREDVDVARN